MKRVFIVLLCLLFLTGCTAPQQLRPSEMSQTADETADYVKAVWLTYYELQELIHNRNEAAFEKAVNAAFQQLCDIGFNTVVVQVRPCADAFYVSEYFPSSRYCFEFQGADMAYDPLAVLCQCADSHHLKIEAWINPYRVSQDDDFEQLSDDNIAKKWHKHKRTRSRVVVRHHRIYFNPADDAVTKLIVNGVREICENYAVDGIHFDDYFYPATDSALDKKEYQKYLAEGGKCSLDDFRRHTVSEMIKSVYTAIQRVNQAKNKQIRFGISPAANMEENETTLYADVRTWATQQGYADYLCPQVYFGFRNIYQPFMFTVKKWLYLTQCDLYIGLPLYKAGKVDKYAAQDDDSIKNEFVTQHNIVARQIRYLSKLDGIKGFYIFSYGCLSDKRCAKEVKNMIAAMQNSNQ